MLRRSPLYWLRWGTVALIGAICAAELVQHVDDYSTQWMILSGLLYAIYAGIFERNIAAFPRRRPRQVWFLLAQIAISTPLESNLSVVTAATIPMVLDKRHWNRWIIGTLSLVTLQVIVRNGFRLYAARTQLPPQITPIAIAIAGLSGIVEILAWHLFAFLAAVLIVRFDEDRRRLALLNAEMKGAQILLMESGRIAERLRISRELHDSLGHHLTSLSLQLEVADHLPDHQVRPKLAEARFLARLILAEIREAVSEWRSETSAALPEALRSLSGSLPGLTTEFEIQDPLPAMAPSVTHALFRCAQEALTNSVRHGSADKVLIRLNHQQEQLRLHIADDGAGCARVLPGNGLRGISSRITDLGGSVFFDSTPGKGFSIDIQIPAPEVALQ